MPRGLADNEPEDVWPECSGCDECLSAPLEAAANVLVQARRSLDLILAGDPRTRASEPRLSRRWCLRTLHSELTGSALLRLSRVLDDEKTRRRGASAMSNTSRWSA